MTTKGKRLAPKRSQQVDQSRAVNFYYDGRPVSGFAGDTVASALFAEGRRIFSRSFKYHRPRGLLCCSGDCPNCIMEVDGRPNVRACRTAVQDGMHVLSQHAWPSVDHDALRIIESFDRFLPIGFYYKALYKPRLLWEVAEPIIRRLAGMGRVRDGERGRIEYEYQYEFVDVLVIGGGPAGMKAALTAAEAGNSVLLVDNETRLGGHLLYEARTHSYQSIDRPGYEIADLLESALHAQPKVRVLSGATAFGGYEGNLVPVLHGDTLLHVRHKSLVVATGCHQYPSVFRNNDLPGVMLSRAALRLINLFGLLPGSKAVVATSNDEGYFAALECSRAGMTIAAVVDARPSPSTLPQAAELKSAGAAIFTGMTIREAHGSGAVVAATIGAVEGSPASTERTIPCDAILLSTAWQGNSALLLQLGCQLELDKDIGQPIPNKMATGIFAAGEVLGLRSLPRILESGRLSGSGARQHVRQQSSNWWQESQRLLSETRQESKALSIPATTDQKKNFVCLCEDVVEKDLRQGVTEGFDEIETLKRYSTVSMGPCQGRMCSRSSTEICGLATERDFGAVGTTTARPPIYPIPLGVLAGPEFHPVKYTSMHYKHAALTKQFLDMGVWKRPEVYSSVAEEYDAVRNRVGLIDVSTLGKLVVKGKDAPALLDNVYTHWFSNLKPGRTRYGVICDEAGIILDDGTVARLAPDHYYVTTSSGNVDVIEQWMKWLSAGTGWCVHVVNITSGIAAVNLAGPEARGVLSKLTDVDVSPSAFPYMACREGNVAGVPAILLRVGFVGETGWEIHFPAEYGEYLWDELLEAGAAADIRPCGVETQRVLRLEKKHIIVGQDTDALANPYDCDMSWVVKLDKPDFIGRHALENMKDQVSQNRLVGFHSSGEGQPDDGNAIVINGKLAGRVTSVRFSPLLKKYIGLAWVPANDAKPGAAFSIHANGKVHSAVVVEKPFYDPEGKRLK
jgi:sarcosine oxidase, subunit alpha